MKRILAPLIVLCFSVVAHPEGRIHLHDGVLTDSVLVANSNSIYPETGRCADGYSWAQVILDTADYYIARVTCGFRPDEGMISIDTTHDWICDTIWAPKIVMKLTPDECVIIRKVIRMFKDEKCCTKR